MTHIIRKLILCALSLLLATATAQSWYPHGGTSSPATATWDGANKGASITLSGSNLIAKQTANNGTNFAVRSTTSHASGKYYFEYTSAFSTAGAAVPIGFGTSSATVSSSGYQLGIIDNNSIGLAGSGAVYYRGGSLASSANPAFILATVNQVAIDIGAQLIWFRTSTTSTNWNLTVGADPATGVGGISISPSLSGQLYIMMSTFNTNDETDLNLGGSAYAFTPPAAFGNW